jgi:hypothetical protein
MKRSINLDDRAETALSEILEINHCTITDAIHAALIAYSMSDKKTIFPEERDNLFRRLQEISLEKHKMTLEAYCNCHAIKIDRLKYLLRSTGSGASVSGFGNARNKYRDKNDERMFKTHTAWIANCLKADFDLNLQE